MNLKVIFYLSVLDLFSWELGLGHLLLPVGHLALKFERM
jgi:hypothetical protein